MRMLENRLLPAFSTIQCFLTPINSDNYTDLSRAVASRLWLGGWATKIYLKFFYRRCQAFYLIMIESLYLTVHKLFAPVLFEISLYVNDVALTIKYQIYHTLHGAFTNMFSTVYMSN